MKDLYLKLLKLKSKHVADTIILEATVVTGLEIIALREIINNNIAPEDEICHVPGRVYFNVQPNMYPQVITLQSIDNINIMVDLIPDLFFVREKCADLEQINTILDKINIMSAVRQWAQILDFDGIIEPSKSQHDDAKQKQKILNSAKHDHLESFYTKNEYCHNVLKYRVTCDRSGKNHSFSSTEAAHHFGGRLNDRHFWVVALSDWDINILLRVKEDDSMICLKLTTKSLHRRYLVEFGPTTLRPTISFAMLMLAQLKDGQHIVDPLCGSGSIPVQCMYSFANVIISCGDIHPRAVDRTKKNIDVQGINLRKPNVFRWNATQMPFKDSTIDAIVSDLPFGKRSGSIKENVTLYKRLAVEFARVLKPKTGRIVLLTKDGNNLYKALGYKEVDSPWYISQIIIVNVGALKCTLLTAVLKK